MRTARVSIRSAAAILTATMLVTGCGGNDGTSGEGTSDDSNSSPEFKALVKAAQEEGSVVLYSADSDEQMASYAQLFKQAYGIDVVSQRLTQGPLQERIDQEIQAGQVQADVLTFTVDPAWSDRMHEAGEIAVLTPEELPNMELLDDEFKSDAYVINRVNPLGVAYNTDLLDESDLPDDIADIVSMSDLTGRVGTPNVQVGGAYHLWHYALREQLGPDEYEQWLHDFVELDPVTGDSIVPFLTQVGAGEMSVALPAPVGLANAVIRQGAPMAIYYPEPVVGTQSSVQAMQHGPHPSAAKLFVNWLLSEDAVKVACGTGDCAATHLDVEGQLDLPENIEFVDSREARRVGEETLNGLFEAAFAQQ